jgi:hypothetical protein
MILSWLIMALSMAMFFFYFQATCQKILRRQFEQEYFHSIANVIRLEFPSLQNALAEPGATLDYSRLPKMLRSDFHALTYLLKNTAGASQRYSREERVLMLYFRWQLISLAARRTLKVGEKRAILKLASVLRYFANVIGQRVNTAGFGDLRADCLVNL